MRKQKIKVWFSVGIMMGALLGSSSITAEPTQAIQIESVQPYYGAVSEDQVFILRFNQAVKAETILPYSFCQSSAIGEDIPLQGLVAEQAKELLTKQSYGYSAESADEYVVAQCAQRLAPGSTVRLQLFDQTQHNLVPRAFTTDKTGVSFTVRTPLRAQLLCEKTKSTADCNPLSALSLRFSAPVQASIAQQLQLITPNNTVLTPQPTTHTDAFIDSVDFAAPKTPQAELRWRLPSSWEQLKDDAGRSLANPDFFQQPVKIAPLAPLLKFAHEGIGVVEQETEGPALLPLAVRGIEPDFLSAAAQSSAGQLRQLRVESPEEMFEWYVRMEKTQPNTTSLFDKINTRQQTQQLTLPAAPSSQDKEIELIGVPLEGAGLHIVEAQSAKLGQAYIEDSSKMYIRSAALVTNLAVHSKLSNNQLLVWVSQLDTAHPVADVDITVLNCEGTMVAEGHTDAKGRWIAERDFSDEYCPETGLSGFFIAATTQSDSSFVLSSWDKGLESWRFQLPYFYGSDQSEMAHTVSDRPLFLAGETVHLKHYWRGESGDTLSVNQRLPELVVRHAGSGDEITQALAWQRTPTGGWYALSTIGLAKNTLLGQYQVWLQGEQHQYNSASFYVEAFKRPYLTGKLAVSGLAKTPLVAADQALLDIQLNYISGGVAASQPVQITALTQQSNPFFSDYDEYRFSTQTEAPRPSVIVDKNALVLNNQGAAQLPISLTPSSQVEDLVVDVSFMDPNGQVQSLQQRQRLWPAEVVVGVSHPYWVDGDSVSLKGVVLDPSGQPVTKQKVEVTGQKQHYYTTRQRMVGGYYRYDSQEQLDDLGQLCQAETDDKGEWHCTITVPDGGQLILHSRSMDAHGHSYTSISSLWLGGEEQAQGRDNHDRIDVIADKKTAEPGETVRFQVQMPFAEATALIAVEQDKVLHTEVVQLKRESPFFELKVQDNWGPNVYVSVLALRGRVQPATWRSLMDGGWKSPLDWYKAYKNNENMTVSTTVDLAKPSFRYGIAQLKIPNSAHAIQVTLSAEQPVYKVGETAHLNIEASLENGQPAAQASVLLVGVDQALLELRENKSWSLLDAMYPAVGYGVRTATMQSEVIGRRHYGRKAVAAGGGGGGGAPTREILDSLLVWRTDVLLDEQGKARVEVPLNHSLTQFELVALVDSAGSHFGVGQTHIQTQQPVQIMSGLPAVVRTGDIYEAQVTVRNREKEKITLVLHAEGRVNDELLFDLALGSQEVAAQTSATFSRKVEMPAQLGANEGVVKWTLTARNAQRNEIVDQLQFEQAWQAQVPVTTQQVVWQRLLGYQSQQLSVSLPKGALQYEGRDLGQVQLEGQSSLGHQAIVREWFEQYPYTCFEQQASKYVALHDGAHWQELMQELPAYLDENNLLRYFPSPYIKGSAGLNAYILSLSAYSPEQTELPAPLAQQLLQGLHDYVEGRRDQPRTSAVEQVAFYLAALDALARYDMVPAHRLDAIALALEQWPTSALIDGLRVLPNPSQRAQAEKVLQSRLVSRGAALMFTQDNTLNTMPELMVSPVTNQAKLLLTVADQPAWQAHIPGLVHGLLAQQQQGRWGTTTENSWALLALERVDPSSSLTEPLRYAVGGQPQVQTEVPFKADWGWEQNGPVHIAQVNEAAAPLWIQLRASAAVPVTEPRFDGYEIQRTVIPIEQAKAGQWQVGDSYEVSLTIKAAHSSVWTVINDAIPAGAVVLESPVERDSTVLRPSYSERLYTGYRAYMESLPAGESELRYRVRLNTAGHFKLPPTSVESLYDASVQAQLPGSEIEVYARP